jgi:hypothetical protein
MGFAEMSEGNSIQISPVHLYWLALDADIAVYTMVFHSDTMVVST